MDEAVRDPLTCDLERFVGLEHIDPESLRIKRWGLIADGTSFTRKFNAGQVLFINAVAEVTRERAQSFLEDDHIEKIVAACTDFVAAPGFAHVATLDEIRSHAANLSIPLYVRPATATRLMVREDAAEYTVNPLREVVAEWQASSAVLRTAMDDLFAKLAEAVSPKSQGYAQSEQGQDRSAGCRK